MVKPSGRLFGATSKGEEACDYCRCSAHHLRDRFPSTRWIVASHRCFNDAGACPAEDQESSKGLAVVITVLKIVIGILMFVIGQGMFWLGALLWHVWIFEHRVQKDHRKGLVSMAMCFSGGMLTTGALLLVWLAISQ